MSELTDKVKKYAKAAGIGLALGVATHTVTIHTFRSLLKDGSGVYATEKAWRNASYNGDPISTFVSTYADNIFEGPASLIGPGLGIGVGVAAGRRAYKKKK